MSAFLHSVVLRKCSTRREMHFCEKLGANCTVVLEKSAKSATLSWKLQVGLFCTLTLCNAELGFQTA